MVSDRLHAGQESGARRRGWIFISQFAMQDSRLRVFESCATRVNPYLKEIAIKHEHGGWLNILIETSAFVLFGNGFGEIINPMGLMLRFANG
jgi:hypothetical protein